MKLFGKKVEKNEQIDEKKEFFIRVFEADWIDVVKCLRSKYDKHDIRIVDDVAAVDGADQAIVKIYFEGDMNDYVNALVDLAKNNINRIQEDNKEPEEKEEDEKK